MIEAKIRLSAKEMELVTNADWILTKNGIMEKARLLLERLQEQELGLLPVPANGVGGISHYGIPKISKGENYGGLPYLVLDYPRIFHKENTLAIRTMFWWGNFFSTTLHLAGSHQQRLAAIVKEEFEILQNLDFHICINDREWEHHFEPSNYIPLAGLTKAGFNQILEGRSFIKIAQKIPLHQWDDAGSLLLSNFKLLTGMIAVSSQGDGKVP
jgi:hypothetical protein